MIGRVLDQVRDGGSLRARAMALKNYTNDAMVSRALRRNHIHLSGHAETGLRQMIANARNVPFAETDFELNFRLHGFRNTVVPWLASVIDLRDLRILEVGCGSGAGTVAMAEQGAVVTGIDIDPLCLSIGRERISSYGLSSTMQQVDGSGLPQGEFDLIIFFASLEHMTQEERLQNIVEAWNLLPSGGHLCVVETPNRLWFYDDHTSALPFFDWLPDSLALRYANYSPKLASTFGGASVTENTLRGLARSGRGMSYHEFEVAGIPCDAVAGCMVEYLRRNPLYWAKFHLTSDSTYSRLIRRQAPHVHKAFFYHRLDLLLKKN